MPTENDVEEWRPAKGIEDAGVFYDVSNFGRVRRSLTAPHRISTKPGRLLNPDNHNSGYARVSLHINGKAHRVFVHRLVAWTFLGEARKYAQVNHKDGNRHNNCVENLEWCTAQQNVRHAWDTGLSAAGVGENASRAKLTNRDAIVIRAARQRGVSLKNIAEVFGVTESCISNVDRMASFSEVTTNG